jgi:hypothetical protein
LLPAPRFTTFKARKTSGQSGARRDRGGTRSKANRPWPSCVPLRRLKAGGYKVVQKAKEQLETLPEYDAMLVKDQKVPAVASRPISSVVQTVSQ